MQKEEIIIYSQLALFFGEQLQKPEEIWIELNKQFGGIFNEKIAPIIIPVPNQPQLNDVPIVQLRTDDGLYTCNIARGRVDFFIAGAGKEKYEDIKTDLLEKFEIFSDFFLNNTKINRVGFINRFFIEDSEQDKTISKLLNDNFTKIYNQETSSDNTYEVDIKYISRIKVADFDVNNHISIGRFFANISGQGTNIKGISIIRDINTIPEKNSENINLFSVEKIKDIINGSENTFKISELKKVLWPQNE